MTDVTSQYRVEFTFGIAEEHSDMRKSNLIAIVILVMGEEGVGKKKRLLIFLFSSSSPFDSLSLGCWWNNFQ